MFFVISVFVMIKQNQAKGTLKIRDFLDLIRHSHFYSEGFCEGSAGCLCGVNAVFAVFANGLR